MGSVVHCVPHSVAFTAVIWQLRNNERSVWVTSCGTAQRVATCPDAGSSVNNPLSEPLITLTTHKAVTAETKCPCPELCDQDVSITKLVHMYVVNCASLCTGSLELR